DFFHWRVAGTFADAKYGRVHDFDAFSERHDGVGDAHAEILMEMRLQALFDTLLNFAHEVAHGMRRNHAESIDQRERIHMPVFPNALYQIERPFQFSAREIDRKEHDLKAVVMRILGSLDRGLNRLFHRPAIGEIDHVLAGRDLHHHTVDTGVDGTLDV